MFIFLFKYSQFKNLATFQKYPNHRVSNDLRYFLFTLLCDVILRYIVIQAISYNMGRQYEI